MHGLLLDDWSEQRRSGDTLCLFKAFVEGGARGATPTANFGCDGENGVEGPGGTFCKALKCIVGRVENRDEKVASREESAGMSAPEGYICGDGEHVEEFPGFRFRDQAL